MLTLSAADLQQLTGYKLAEKQCGWLKANGVPFRLDHRSRPIVCASHVEAWVTGVELRPSSRPLLENVR
jgi:hypothetical protein